MSGYYPSPMPIITLCNQTQNLTSYNNKHLLSLHTCGSVDTRWALCISHPPPRTRADPACSSHGNDRSAREQAPKHRHLPTLWPHPVCQCSTVQEKRQGVGRAGQGTRDSEWRSHLLGDWNCVPAWWQLLLLSQSFRASLDPPLPVTPSIFTQSGVNKPLYTE